MTSREKIIIVLMLSVALTYIATLILQPSLARDVLEIFKYVVVAIISFYLGYAIRERDNFTSNSLKLQRISKRSTVGIVEIGYTAIVLAIGLLIWRLVLCELDLTIWVEIYLLCSGITMIKVSKLYV